MLRKIEILPRKIICLDDKIKSKLKLRNFKKVFKIIKTIEFEIHSKYKEIGILQVVKLLIAYDKKNPRIQKVGSDRRSRWLGSGWRTSWADSEIRLSWADLGRRAIRAYSGRRSSRGLKIETSLPHTEGWAELGLGRRSCKVDLIRRSSRVRLRSKVK